MSSSASPLSPSLLESEIRAIMSSSSFHLENETQKSIRNLLAKRLKIDEFPSEKKSLIKQLVTRIVQEQDDQDSDDTESLEESNDENDDSSEPQNAIKTKTKKTAKKKQAAVKKKKAAPKKSPSSASSYSSSVQSLLNLGQAMRLGPRLHRGLKEMETDEERIDALTERLQEAGATWKGRLPTSQDVARAKAEKQRKDDLDGMDTSLIIEGSRRRRGRGTVNYTVETNDDDSDEEEEHELQDKEVQREEERRPRKRTKTKEEDTSGEEHSEDGDFRESESESEAEFDD